MGGNAVYRLGPSHARALAAAAGRPGSESYTAEARKFKRLTRLAQHHLKHDIFIYDSGTRAYVIGATVTVSYTGGSQTAVTEPPHGNVQFRLPGELTTAQLVVVADGYCTFDDMIALGHRPHVGGRGYWIGLSACEP